MSSQNDDIKLATFYELWGCKESYIKALGVGLSLDVSKLDFRNENDQVQKKKKKNAVHNPTLTPPSYRSK